MYELSFWIEGYKEDACRFETLEEAMSVFEKWVGDYALDLRSKMQGAPRSAKPTPVATIKIQKMEDVISVNI